MNPSYEVNIWNFNSETIPVKLLVLATWESALRAEMKGLQVASQPVAPIVRGFLSAPVDYPLDELSAHITESYRDIKEQLGME